MTGVEDYSAPFWLPGGHVQTVVTPLIERFRRFTYPERTRWLSPDSDFVDIDWIGPSDAQRLLVLFHGLEGSSKSHYARDLARQALADGGWRLAVVHFRSCSGEPNWKARAYHAGDSDEVDWVLRRFANEHPLVQIHPVGVSLGGNALLKWLVETDDATGVVRKAAAVSAPFDMAAFGDNMGRGWMNKLYGWWFLSKAGMREKALWKIEAFPNETAVLDPDRVRAASTLPDFEDCLTAPLHGFRDKSDYYEKASTAAHLARIRVPTLLLNARNDPFLPERVLPGDGTLPNTVTLDFPDSGGHGGFPGRKRWMARRVLDFLSN